MTPPSTTRQEQAYQALRGDILAGRVHPGQKLPFAELCDTYGVSVGVIREALSRLVEQGLVQTAPQQGFFVTPISREDLVHLTVARREIESLTLRHAIAEGDLQWEGEVLATHHRLASTPQLAPDDPDRLNDEWAEIHSRFHETLLLGCENPRLTAIATQLRASAELYRRWSLPFSAERERDIAGEHKALADAVVARDTERAVELLAAHIQLTTDLLLESEWAESSDDLN